MPLDIIVGTQWGDEGKGHITDLLAGSADLVTRFSGGDNAGHTVTVGTDVFKLHLIPSGIIHKKTTCLIGNGTVVNPVILLKEMDALAERGVDVSPSRLKLDRKAHLITPAHIALDEASESLRGLEAIGTTKRGIGPAYTDKTSRIGLRAGLLENAEALGDAMKLHIDAKNKVLDRIYGAPQLDASTVAASFAAYAQRLKPHLVDSSVYIDEALQRGASVLAEGAQGTFLDLDHGTYPFVTSSWPTAGGALIGLGVGPKKVGRIIGIAKAFTSRVGSGPFPCQLESEMALRLRGTGENPWDEYGTTTGRPRRVGWLDLVMVRHAARINSLTDLAVTKLDILSGLKQLSVCVAYELNGERIDYVPSDLEQFALCRPVYELLDGWEEDITSAGKLAALPANARRYLDFISDITGVPITYVSVGPGRTQVIHG
jgi:adenylosuccinate synthase